MEARQQQTPDFVALYEHYARMAEHHSAIRAELRRTAEPDALRDIPSFYRLMIGWGTHPGWQRVTFFLPFASHQPEAESLGAQLAKQGVREMRLFQVTRSESPNDIIQLRRLVQQIRPALDWQSFGEMLFYWNRNKKRNLLEDFFLHTNPDPKSVTKGVSS